MLKTINFPDFGVDRIPCRFRLMDSSSFVQVKEDGTVFFARTRQDKDTLHATVADDDLLLLSWHGSYRTDVFVVSVADFRKFYNEDPPRRSAHLSP